MVGLGVNYVIGGRGKIGTIKLESITRPSAGERVLQEALAKVPPVDNSGDADFSIGGPSSFSLTDPRQRTNPSVTYNFPPEDEDKDRQDGIVVHDYDYVDRSVEVIRVEQEGEPDNWVEVERILAILFVNRDTGEYVRFNFDWSKKPSSSRHA
ncbi:hypothetical protein P9279_22175 [Mesorhizobium sp. WSM4962]|uniref:hypothetical protein n=1 Tax=Mesorhizobium sp. WSM4962 TaxID=3038548 RepID=UPI002417F4C6|nr:hypothetical protein [Mesorhizobium sp. WSM4962]MDG4903221.1 hypothetical protein [Mesorhizobium sp. WSM4962]